MNKIKTIVFNVAFLSQSEVLAGKIASKSDDFSIVLSLDEST